MGAQMVAFLRGINLGRRRLTNPELVGAFDQLGFEGATAFQASGNVIFDPGRDPKPELMLAGGLVGSLGFPVEAFPKARGGLSRRPCLMAP